MRAACSTLSLVVLLGAIARPAAAVVIDDFTEGGGTFLGPALVDQLGLDPAHVIGGARRIGVERVGSTLTIDAPAGFTFSSTDWGYFELEYGATTPLSADLTEGGHDRLLFRFGEVGPGFHPFGVYLSLPSSSSSNGRSIYVQDAWDGILLEVPFTAFPAPATSVGDITIGAIRNPGGSGFELESISTARRTREGDFNYDGVVDVEDLTEWTKRAGFAWYNGPGIGFISSADADQDGRVDGADFLIWQRNVGAGASNSIPEPGAAALAMTSAWAGGALRTARRRRAA